MEEEVFLQGLCCSLLIGVETAAWAGCMRVEISGTALHVPLLVIGFHQPGSNMLATPLTPLSAISPPGMGLAPMMTTFSLSFRIQLGSHLTQPFHRECEKGKERNQARFNNQYGGRFIQTGNSPPRNHDDKDAGGRASLS